MWLKGHRHHHMGGQAREKQRSCTQGHSVFCLSLDPDLFFLSSGGIPPVSSEQGKVNVASPQFPRHPTGQRAGSHLGSKDPQESPSCPRGAHCRPREQSVPAGTTGGLWRLPLASISVEEICADVLQGQQAPGL